MRLLWIQLGGFEESTVIMGNSFCCCCIIQPFEACWFRGNCVDCVGVGEKVRG